MICSSLPSPFSIFRARNKASAAGTMEPWFVCIALVGFDVDRGQVVEACFPDAALTDSEMETLCFHAMPDSAAGGTGREDAVFSFRIISRLPTNLQTGNSEQPSKSVDRKHMRENVVTNDTALNDASINAEKGSYSSGIRKSVSAARDDRVLLLAHTLFRQGPDPSSIRGSFQKALVLVTSTPYLTFPKTILSLLANAAFVYGRTVLERAYHEISGWPDPRVQTSARVLSLQILGQDVTVSLPKDFLTSFAMPFVEVYLDKSPTTCSWKGKIDCASDNTSKSASVPTPVELSLMMGNDATTKAELESALSVQHDVVVSADLADKKRDVPQFRSDPDAKSHPGSSAPDVLRCWPLVEPCESAEVAPFQEISILEALLGAHDKLLLLWELVALGEPLVILAPTPSQCSAAVFAVISLIHPLPFVGDWRPYFCIQDPEYARLVTAASIREALPLGAVYGVTSPHIVATIPFNHVLTITGASDSSIRVAYKAGLRSPHKPFLQRGKSLALAISRAKSVARGANEGGATAASSIVRQCLRDVVTVPVLRAFDRYLVQGHDLHQNGVGEWYKTDPFGRLPRLENLDLNTFPENADLSASGMHAMFRSTPISKSRARPFYVQFVQSPVFEAWWNLSRKQAESEYIRIHRKNVLEACVRGVGLACTGPKHSEYTEPLPKQDDLIDLTLRVRMELTTAQPEDSVLRGKLMTLLESLKAQLPPDLKQSVGGRA